MCIIHACLPRKVKVVRRTRMRRGVLLGALVLAAGLALISAAPAGARTIDYWVAAVPTSWNIVPNGHDAITGMMIPPDESIIHTVVYQRFTPHWRRRIAIRNRPFALSLKDTAPIPRLRANAP